MNRRHFVKLSSTAAAVVLFNQLTYADSAGSMINPAEEAWAETNEGWIKLTRTAGGVFAKGDVEVHTTAKGGARSVNVRAGKAALKAIRLKWGHRLKPGALSLGDGCERLYGDSAWRTWNSDIKNLWYVLINDGKSTSCFGVKTGCNAMCWWALKPD